MLKICEPCQGIGIIEYTEEPHTRECLICKGLGTIEVENE